MEHEQTDQLVSRLNQTSERGQLIVVSGPSGAGKTVLCRQVVQEVPRLCYSISHTTRPRRAQEAEGKDYFFIDKEQFEQMVKQGQFLEWAEVHGNFYGTSKAFISQKLEQQQDVIMDIDVQGAMQVKQQKLPCVLVFVAPPSLDTLEQRLRGRATDSAGQIRLRIQNAVQEITRCSDYDYLIVNQVFKQALLELESIIRAERCRNRKKKIC
jgi:guanylate kinase